LQHHPKTCVKASYLHSFATHQLSEQLKIVWLKKSVYRLIWRFFGSLHSQRLLP
jgi:hypothetical protein